MDNKLFFQKNQKEILWMANSEAGRELLGIKSKEKIVKVSPNSIHYFKDIDSKGNFIVQGQFFCYEKVSKFLLPIITKMNIASENYRKEIEQNKYNAYLHFAELQKSNYLPEIYLTITSFFSGSGDGRCSWDVSGNATWATVRDGATSESADTAGTTTQVNVEKAGANYYADRAFFPTDTSGLTVNATITGADFKPYLTSNVGTGPWINDVVQTSQASNTALTTADWNKVTFTSGVRLDTGGTTGVKVFSLNATGLTWISKTGFTKLGLVDKLDFDNTAPGDAIKDLLQYATSESANDPYIEVTYTLPGGGFPFILF